MLVLMPLMSSNQFLLMLVFPKKLSLKLLKLSPPPVKLKKKSKSIMSPLLSKLLLPKTILMKKLLKLLLHTQKQSIQVPMPLTLSNQYLLKLVFPKKLLLKLLKQSPPLKRLKKSKSIMYPLLSIPLLLKTFPTKKSMKLLPHTLKL